MNKYSLFLLLFGFLAPHQLLATGQIPDGLVWEGESYQLYSNPLVQHPNFEELRSQFFGDQEGCLSTACWDSYYVKWELTNNQLFLTGIYSCCFYEDSIQADLKKLFPTEYQNGKVKADWVTQNLWIPSGKLLLYVHSGYESIYEKETKLNLVKGKLIAQKTFDNSHYNHDQANAHYKNLYLFILKHIDWNKFPHLKEQECRVFAKVKIGNEGKLVNVEIIRGCENKAMDQEVINILNTIPKWSYYYKWGEVRGAHTIFSIQFSEKVKQKYQQE